jgi:hypothetical protein
MKESPAVHQDEIAKLAYLNWQREGSPSGCDQHYRLRAEQQPKSAEHLLAIADEAQAQAKIFQAALKTKANGTLTTPVRPKLACSIYLP